jgi:meromycolic acid enoyl-[acyl-carrier-protein] reductase
VAASAPVTAPQAAATAPQPLLAGRRILVTGVLTHHSLAFGVAERLLELGADVILTGHGRARRLTERAAGMLPRRPHVLELDVLEERDFEGLATALSDRWDAVDGVFHAIAWMPPQVWHEGFFDAAQEHLDEGLHASVYSFKSLAGALRPLLARSPSGASLVTMTVMSGRYSRWYAWMGVAKAMLDALTKHLAVELGPERIRVNAIACGPVRTNAASGIPDFDQLEALVLEKAPLDWDSRDHSVVGGPAAFLMSDLARGITGEILHVDGGFHAAL